MKKTAALNQGGVNEPRLYRVVAAKIEELIRAENIRPGERLARRGRRPHRHRVTRTCSRG